MDGKQHDQGPQEPDPQGHDPYQGYGAPQGYGPPSGAAPPQGHLPPHGHTPPPGPPGYPPPQGYIPPQGYGPQPVAPVAKKRRTWPWILLGMAIFLVVVFSCMAGGGEEGESTSGAEGGNVAEEEGARTVGMGEAGEVSSWIVTVNSTETVADVGDGYVQDQAQGEFVIVDMTVENSGGEATYFDESALSLIDADGNEHSAGYVPGDDDFFLEQINPGNQATGRAAFDVPEGTEPAALKVEDVWSLDEPLEIRLD